MTDGGRRMQLANELRICADLIENGEPWPAIEVLLGDLACDAEREAAQVRFGERH